MPVAERGNCKGRDWIFGWCRLINYSLISSELALHGKNRRDHWIIQLTLYGSFHYKQITTRASRSSTQIIRAAHKACLCFVAKQSTLARCADLINFRNLSLKSPCFVGNACMWGNSYLVELLVGFAKVKMSEVLDFISYNDHTCHFFH